MCSSQLLQSQYVIQKATISTLDMLGNYDNYIFRKSYSHSSCHCKTEVPATIQTTMKFFNLHIPKSSHHLPDEPEDNTYANLLTVPP